MKSLFASFTLMLTFLIGCKTLLSEPSNDRTTADQFSRTLAPALDNRILDLLAGLALFEENNDQWPLSKTEFMNFFPGDSLSNSLDDFRSLVFSISADTLIANFDLAYDSSTNISGLLSMKVLNDSTHYLKLVSKSDDTSMIKVNYNGTMQVHLPNSIPGNTHNHQR